MDEPQPRQENKDLEATAALPVTNPPEPATDREEEALWAATRPPEVPERVPEPVTEEPVEAEAVFDKFDRDTTSNLSGLTVGDGFKFGCGFVLALAIGTLAFMVVMTAFLAVGTLMGFKLPF